MTVDYTPLFERNYKNRDLAKFYLKRYIAFIEYCNCKTHLPKDGEYSERHHIIPKSFGGKNNKENIIKLTARQHFIAHWILSHTEDESMIWAFWLFVNGYSTKQQERKDLKITSRIYEKIKEQFSRLISESNKRRKVNPDSFKGEKNGAYGKHWYSDINGKNYLLNESDTIIKQLCLKRGMYRSKDHNQKIGNSLRGKKKNYAVFAKGKILINNGKENIFITKEEIEKYRAMGYSVGGLPRKKKMI